MSAPHRGVRQTTDPVWPHVNRYGWRWAFLLQLPLFGLSLALTSWNLHYVTPVSPRAPRAPTRTDRSQGRSASATEVLRKIDWAGSFSLLGAVSRPYSVQRYRGVLTRPRRCSPSSCSSPRASATSSRYVRLSSPLLHALTGDAQWASPAVHAPFAAAVVLAAAFFAIEIRFAREPVLPPMLVRMKVPMLVGLASFMVSMCNFAIMYNLPTWFQTVMLTSAGEAGECTAGPARDAVLNGAFSLGAHLIPNGVAMSMGSMFAGYVMTTL